MAVHITLIDEREKERERAVAALRKQGFRVNPSRRLSLDPGLLDAPRQDALIVNLAFSRGDSGLHAFRQADPSVVVVALSDVSPPSSDPYVLRAPVHAVLPQTTSTDELIEVVKQELNNTGRFIHRIQWQDRSIDLTIGVLTVGETKYPLTTNECALIRYLAGNKERPVSRGELLTRVWGYREGVYTRAVDSTVKRLRPKLEVDPKNPVILRSIRGIGYQLNLMGSQIRARALTEPSLIEQPDQLTPPPVPASAGTFFGRSDESHRLNALISAGHRLITVTGPGGMGKSRLVREWAINKALENTWFIDLSDARSEDDLYRTTARALMAPIEQPTRASLTEHLSHLAGQIVVLDNIEQVVDAVKDMVSILFRQPGPQILCTSTARLNHSGEVCLEVGPLSFEEAQELLVERVEGLRGQTLHEPTKLLRDVVHHLEGHPLAIELAASRSRMVSLSDVLARLKDDALALTGRPHRGSDVQSVGLETVIAWSWSLLSPQEKEVLMQCAVFHGGFSANAALEVVTVDSADCFELLQQLRDHSFLHLVPRTDGRLRLNMYRSIRAFVERKFREAPFRNATESRHRDHYLGQFQPMMRYDRGMVLASRFSRSQDLRRAWADDQENVLAIRNRFQHSDPDTAVTAALVWDWLASLFSSAAQRELNLQRVMMHHNVISPELQIELAIAIGQLKFLQGQADSALETLMTVMPLAGNDPQANVDLHRAAGWIQMHAPSTKRMESIRAAAVHFDQALSVAQSAGLNQTLVEIYHDIGRCHMLLAQPKSCEAAFEKGLRLALQNGDPGPICHAEYSLGMLHLQIADNVKAESTFRRLEERTRQMGGEKWREVVLFRASALGSQGKLSEAITLLNDLLIDAHRVADPGHRVFIGLDLAICHQLAGHPQRALELYDTFMPVAAKDGGPFTDAIHSHYEAFCRATVGQSFAPPRRIDFSSFVSEAQSLDALFTTALWIQAGRPSTEKVRVLTALEQLASPAQSNSEWTHIELNLTARTIYNLIVRTLDDTSDGSRTRTG